MDPEYGRRYRELYERHWWWRAREHVVLGAVRRLPGLGPPARILDIGCGDGLLFPRLAEWGDVEGVEPSDDVLSDGRTRDTRIFVGPFDARYQPGHRFQLILMLDVIEHLDDPVGALRHAASLLEPNGSLLVTVPAFLALWTSHDVLNEHRTRYTKATLQRDLRAAGLSATHMEYFFHWTFPVKAAQHVRETVVPGRPTPPRIPPGPVNAALYYLSRLEYVAARCLHLPFGSSLLALSTRP